MKIEITARQSNRKKVDGGHVVLEPTRYRLMAMDTDELGIPDDVRLSKIVCDKFGSATRTMRRHRDLFKTRHGKTMKLPLKWTKPISLEVRVDGDLVMDTTTILFEGQLDWTLRCSNAEELADYLSLAVELANVLQIED